MNIQLTKSYFALSEILDTLLQENKQESMRPVLKEDLRTIFLAKESVDKRVEEQKANKSGVTLKRMQECESYWSGHHRENPKDHSAYEPAHSHSVQAR